PRLSLRRRTKAVPAHEPDCSDHRLAWFNSAAVPSRESRASVAWVGTDGSDRASVMTARRFSKADSPSIGRRTSAADPEGARPGSVARTSGERFKRARSGATDWARADPGAVRKDAATNVAKSELRTRMRALEFI